MLTSRKPIMKKSAIIAAVCVGAIAAIVILANFVNISAVIRHVHGG